jgi:hypothetical protein
MYLTSEGEFSTGLHRIEIESGGVLDRSADESFQCSSTAAGGLSTA